MVCALLATTIGCDTCPDGIKGIGPSTVTKFTNDLYSTKRHPNSKNAESKVMEWIKSNIKKIEGTATNATIESKLACMQAYAEAFICEPARTMKGDSELEKNNRKNINLYLTEKEPQKLCHYVNAFKSSKTKTIDKDLSYEKCFASLLESGHLILKGDECYKCQKCAKLICLHCSNIIKKRYDCGRMCLNCYCSKFRSNENVKTNNVDVKTQAEMRQSLVDNGWAVHISSITDLETLDL